MKERRMERLVLLPFTFGCVSESSVAVGVVDHQRPRPRTKPDGTDVKPIHPATKKRREEDEESSSSSVQSVKGTTSLKLLPLSKPRMSKLLSSFKNFAQSFVYKEEEIEELEMEIGYPTDVKRVTHIGLDGSSANTSPIQGRDHLTGPAELFSIKNATVDHHPLKHFELSTATLQQADQAPPLVQASVGGHV